MSEAPTPQQIADSIIRVHKARREAWPPPDESVDANITPTQLLAWVSRWGKARVMWMEHVEIVTEALPLAASVAELDGLARDLIDALQISAKDFQVEKLRLLGE